MKYHNQQHRERKLPVEQLTILAICRFAEPIAATSLAPYVPEMVRSFGVADKDVGGWAGLLTAVFSLTQAAMGVPWGRFSDIHGRKISILMGLTSTMITALMFGFSQNLGMAIAARALAGAGNGNVGIIRTTVAEMVPFKELQPRAFSLMPLVWNIGSIFGPSMGGVLANPLDVKPGETFTNPSFFQRFPYSLPNLVSASIFAFGITIGFLFLEETLETKAARRDWGLKLGHKIRTASSNVYAKFKRLATGQHHEERETEPLLKPTIPTEEDGLPTQPNEPHSAPSMKEVLTPQARLNLITYTLLAMHSMAYDSILPVYLGYKPISSSAPFTTPYNFATNPLKWFGGLGLQHRTIGLLITCYGAFGMLVQFFIFPPVARHFGILKCLQACVVLFPVSYLLMPLTALLPTQEWQVGCTFALMLLKCLSGIFAFPASTILITNSASSLRTLGTLNGFATSFSALGRALGPASVGAVFNLGAKTGYLVMPWWLVAGISVVGAVPVWWVVEGDGFGGDDDQVSDEEEEEEQEGIEEAAEETLVGAAVGQPVGGEDEAETAYGGVGAMLSRTTTKSSTGWNVDAEEEDEEGEGTTVQPSLSRRSSRRVMRRVSAPMNVSRSVSRKYSSNLGQSLSSSTGSFMGQH